MRQNFAALHQNCKIFAARVIAALRSDFGAKHIFRRPANIPTVCLKIFQDEALDRILIINCKRQKERFLFERVEWYCAQKSFWRPTIYSVFATRSLILHINIKSGGRCA
jgi:hypothetical protein